MDQSRSGFGTTDHSRQLVNIDFKVAEPPKLDGAVPAGRLPTPAPSRPCGHQPRGGTTRRPRREAGSSSSSWAAPPHRQRARTRARSTTSQQAWRARGVQVDPTRLEPKWIGFISLTFCNTTHPNLFDQLAFKPFPSYWEPSGAESSISATKRHYNGSIFRVTARCCRMLSTYHTRTSGSQVTLQSLH